MDRASDSGSEGWGFESLPAYQSNIIRTISSQSEAGSDYLFISHNGNKGCRFGSPCLFVQRIPPAMQVVQKSYTYT